MALRYFATRTRNRVFRRNFSLSTSANNKVAVVFSGCGVYDGSEVHEASAYVFNMPAFLLTCFTSAYLSAGVGMAF